jgi:hypothetical protein
LGSELAFFANEGPVGLNIHYFSPLGNGRNCRELELDAASIVASQQELHSFGASSRVPVRFPILVPWEERAGRRRVGQCRCGEAQSLTALLMPEGTNFQCPLELEFGPGNSELPLCWSLFPRKDLQRLGVELPCISWKVAYGSGDVDR